MGAMSMSDLARKTLLEPSEGLGPKARGGYRVYVDCVGVVTGGFGHTAKAGPPIPKVGEVWSPEKCDEVLKADLLSFAKEVDFQLANVVVLQREFDAFVDLAFNIGLGAFKSSSLLRHYRAGDKATTARDFLAWNKAGGKVLPGLVKRREAERNWFLYGHLAHSMVGIADLTAVAPEDMPRLVDHADGAMMRGVNRIIGLAA